MKYDKIILKQISVDTKFLLKTLKTPDLNKSGQIGQVC